MNSAAGDMDAFVQPHFLKNLILTSTRGNNRTMKKIVLATSALAFCAAVSTTAFAGATLDAVKKKGFLQCGVTTGLPGFSSPDDKGNWTGLDVDTCRAVAAAVFGDAQKVKFTPLTAKERFTALQSGEIDILSRNTTWTLTRDSSLGLNFAGINYYDGQGFLVSKNLGVKSALELDGASFCIQAGTTTELNLADYFRANKMAYTPITFDTSDETSKAFDAGRCDALTSDQSQLYALRLKLKNPDGAIVPIIFVGTGAAAASADGGILCRARLFDEHVPVLFNVCPHGLHHRLAEAKDESCAGRPICHATGFELFKKLQVVRHFFDTVVEHSFDLIARHQV